MNFGKVACIFRPRRCSIVYNYVALDKHGIIIPLTTKDVVVKYSSLPKPYTSMSKL